MSEGGEGRGRDGERLLEWIRLELEVASDGRTGRALLCIAVFEIVWAVVGDAGGPVFDGIAASGVNIVWRRGVNNGVWWRRHLVGR